MTLNMYLNGTNRKDFRANAPLFIRGYIYYKDFRANAPPDLYPSPEPSSYVAIFKLVTNLFL